MYIPDFIEPDSLMVATSLLSVSGVGASVTMYPKVSNSNTFILGFIPSYSGNVNGRIFPSGIGAYYQLRNISAFYGQNYITSINGSLGAFQAMYVTFPLDGKFVDVYSFADGITLNYGTVAAGDASAFVYSNVYFGRLKKQLKKSKFW
jgi:hypothetical protein